MVPYHLAPYKLTIKLEESESEQVTNAVEFPTIRSKTPVKCPGREWAVLELTGTLGILFTRNYLNCMSHERHKRTKVLSFDLV